MAAHVGNKMWRGNLQPIWEVPAYDQREFLFLEFLGRNIKRIGHAFEIDQHRRVHTMKRLLSEPAFTAGAKHPGAAGCSPYLSGADSDEAGPLVLGHEGSGSPVLVWNLHITHLLGAPLGMARNSSRIADGYDTVELCLVFTLAIRLAFCWLFGLTLGLVELIAVLLEGGLVAVRFHVSI